MNLKLLQAVAAISAVVRYNVCVYLVSFVVVVILYFIAEISKQGGQMQGICLILTVSQQ